MNFREIHFLTSNLQFSWTSLHTCNYHVNYMYHWRKLYFMLSIYETLCFVLSSYLGISKDRKRLNKALVSFLLGIFLLSWKIKRIIIRCVLFFFFIGWEPTTWPANNCLQMVVSSCVVPSKCVLLEITFCLCVIVTMISGEKWQIAPLSCQGVILVRKQILLVIEW